MRPSISQSQQIVGRAFAAHRAGDVAQAEFLYKLALQADPKQFDALHMLGVIEGQRGNFAGGLARIEQALRVRPKSVEALINLGRMQGELGRYGEAVANFQKALALDASVPVAHNNLAIALRRLGRGEEALDHCDRALKLAPDYADAWNNRGNVLFDLNRRDEAQAAYERAVALQPGHAQAHLGRGNVLVEDGRLNDALAAYDRALALHPGLAEALLGRGNVLHRLARHAEALGAYDGALAIAPNNAEGHRGRGEALASLRRPVDAIAAYERALALDPKLPYAAAAKFFAKRRICDWSGPDPDGRDFALAVERGEVKSQPFIMLLASDSPSQQRIAAERFVADTCPPRPQPLWHGERNRQERIRLAYLSGDFGPHPVSFLLAGMFEAHDRTRFETTAISFGTDAGDPMRARLQTAFDRFVDMRGQGDADIAQRMRELEIDIAVDLAGFTAQSRPNVLAQRPAPVQVNYLGYSGTMGADFIDYILADRIVIPAEHARFYTENVVWLPDSYMANDATRTIAEPMPTRRACGLPDDGFVFCCFNNAYKISPAVFAVWMRLLQAVEGSILWLGEADPAAENNLRREAARHGVAAQRLIFAPKLPDMADHLARQRVADLFLDTLPYNAHATASDALWTGLPVLTCLGTTFAGRVGASLLRAAGLAALVTETLRDYEALACRLAREPALLAAAKAKLAHGRDGCALFDTARFTRHIEAAFSTMWQRHQRGEPAQGFAVDGAAPPHG